MNVLSRFLYNLQVQHAPWLPVPRVRAVRSSAEPDGAIELRGFQIPSLGLYALRFMALRTGHVCGTTNMLVPAYSIQVWELCL